MIGFVILNYETWEKTVDCVQSIYNTYKKDKVIVIVDNQSTNNSLEELSKIYDSDRFREIVLVSTDYNGGFSYGNNFGFNYIYHKYPNIDKVVITNNDIIFKDNSIEVLLNGFKFSDNVILTSPTIFDMKGARTNVPWRTKPNILQELYLISCAPCFYKWEELVEDTSSYMVSGCCFAVDKDLFKEIDCLDDNVFLYNEENIISKKIADKQLKIIFCPDAEVVHDHGSTTGNSSIFVDKEFAKSSIYFFRTYEKLSFISIGVLKIFYALRMTLKLLMRKYDDKSGYKDALQDILFN